MRVLVVAVVLTGLVSAGCQAVVDGHPAAARSGTDFPVVNGGGLRFRPVVSVLPPGPAVAASADRQSADPAVQTAAAQALDCTPGRADPLGGQDDPARPLAACDVANGSRYVLGPAFLTGAALTRVSVRFDSQQSRYVVAATFDAAGTRTWADWTARNVGQQVAMVLKSQVLTAPTVQSAITGGETQITGQFTEADATRLAHDIAGG